MKGLIVDVNKSSIDLKVGGGDSFNNLSDVDQGILLSMVDGFCKVQNSSNE